MGLCVNVLGSGSSGNATMVSDGTTHILVDAGLSGIEICRRLDEFGLEPRQLSAIVVSHEHIDHCRSVATLSKKFDLPVFMEPEALTAAALPLNPAKHRAITAGECFDIGAIAITCFRVSHGNMKFDDKRGAHGLSAIPTLGFVLERSGVKIGIVTDLGYISNLVIERLRGCAGLVLEANHEVNLLKMNAKYPLAQKQRIMSKHGHLSNAQVAQFLGGDFDGLAEHILLAHLSEQNNMPEIALASAREALAQRGDTGRCRTHIELAWPNKISQTLRY